MLHINTENVDKLSILLGVVIGPCTVLSNVVKVIGDVAKIVFYGLLGLNYTPSEAYTKFKTEDLAWEQNVSSKFKPETDKNGKLLIRTGDIFADREIPFTICKAAETNRWVAAYGVLSFQDKRRVEFDQAKKDFVQHLTFIGIGIIRSIPLVGGIGRSAYHAKKASSAIHQQ